MKTTVEKWGNALAVRIPRFKVIETRLRQGSIVEIEVIVDKIALHLRRQRLYPLAQLLKGVTKRNHHAEFDW